MKKETQSDIKKLLGLTALAAVAVGCLSPCEVAPDSSPTPEDAGAYAVVSNPQGALLYARTAKTNEDSHGHGRDALPVTLDKGTYVGKVTGISFEELVQVRTNINDKDISFWVRKTDVTIGGPGQFDSVDEKTQFNLKNKLHSLIETTQF